MQDYKIEFSFEELEAFNSRLKGFFTVTKPVEQMPYYASLETYILYQIWKRIETKASQMEKQFKGKGSMKFDQIQIDVILVSIVPENKKDGWVYGQLMKYQSGRIKPLIERLSEHKMLEYHEKNT